MKLSLFSPLVANLNKSTMTVTISMDKQSVSQIVGRDQEYRALPQQLKPAMEGIADYVRETMIPTVFEKEGPGWRPLSKRTQRERQEQGFGPKHPILRRTRDLFRELTEKQHPRHIEIIKVGKKARIEVGGSSKKFLENQLGKSSQHLPARPMIPGTSNIPILDRDRIEMSKIIERAYQQQLSRTK